MFVVVILYCVQLFFGSKNVPKPFSPFLFLSFAIVFLFFYFLSSILLEFSKWLISQNIGCLIKTLKKKSSSKQFSRG